MPPPPHQVPDSWSLVLQALCPPDAGTQVPVGVAFPSYLSDQYSTYPLLDLFFSSEAKFCSKSLTSLCCICANKCRGCGTYNAHLALTPKGMRPAFGRAQTFSLSSGQSLLSCPLPVH